MFDTYTGHGGAAGERPARRAGAGRGADFRSGLRAVATPVWAGLRGIGSLISGIRQKRRERLTARELSALDDRLLRDIGLLRGDIPWVAMALSRSGGARPGTAQPLIENRRVHRRSPPAAGGPPTIREACPAA